MNASSGLSPSSTCSYQHLWSTQSEKTLLSGTTSSIAFFSEGKQTPAFAAASPPVSTFLYLCGFTSHCGPWLLPEFSTFPECHGLLVSFHISVLFLFSFMGSYIHTHHTDDAVSLGSHHLPTNPITSASLQAAATRCTILPYCCARPWETGNTQASIPGSRHWNPSGPHSSQRLTRWI